MNRERGVRHRYLLDGVEQRIDERAQIGWHEGVIAALGHRVVPDQGVRLLVGATLPLPGVGEEATAELRWQVGHTETKAAYRLAAGRLEVEIDGTKAVHRVPDDAVLSPLLRATQGNVMAELARTGGERTVVVPDIRPSALADPRALLQPVLQQRSATLGPLLAGRKAATYDGDGYAEGRGFELDEDDVLVGYDFLAPPEQITGFWRVELA